jgi:hypothetical protein
MRFPPPSEQEYSDLTRRFASQYGKRATLALVYRVLDLPTPGRPVIVADPRHRRMAELLGTDPELIRRRAQGDRRLLSEAARKAILENPAPNELTKDGEPDPNIVKRPVRTMPFFSFDIPEEGFDLGFWRP